MKRCGPVPGVAPPWHREDDSTTFRAFISADLPAIPPLVTLTEELRRASDSLRVVSPDHLHLTLKFLGDTEEGLVPELVGVIQDSCRGVGSFPIRVRGTGAFPSLSRMNVLWVGIEMAEPLARIANSLEAKLEPLGFPAERRPWTGHMTLARVKGARELDRVRAVLEAHRDEIFAEHRVDEIRLKKSVLTPQGPVYTTLEAVRL